MSEHKQEFHPGMKMMLARKWARLSQAQLGAKLAAETGDDTWLKQSKVSDYERGVREMTWTVLRLLSRVLGRPVTWYVDESDIPAYLTSGEEYGRAVFSQHSLFPEMRRQAFANYVEDLIRQDPLPLNAA